MVPLKFGMAIGSSPYSVLVSVYANDGSVAVVHGGVEIGQGINTKVLCIHVHAYLQYTCILCDQY